MVKTKSRPKRAGKGSGRLSGPHVVVHDPRSVQADGRFKTTAVVYGENRGTPEQLQRIVNELIEFASPADFPFPLKDVNVAFNGRPETAKMRRDGIDVLHDNGTLGDIELIAAREFQAAFDVASDVRIGSINVNRTGNGTVDIEAITDRRIKAIKKYTAMLDVLGGQNTLAGLTVLWFVGYRRSFAWLAKTYHRKPEYFSVALCCGLQTIAHSQFYGRRNK
jgi:hypothetical protein